MAFVKKIGAILIGMALGILVIMGVQMISSWLYPLPAGLDPMDPAQTEALLAYMQSLPATALWLVIVGYALGCFVAGWFASWMSGWWPWAALVVGVIFTGFGFMNLAALPQPFWFGLVSTVTYIPFALMGGQQAKS